MTATIALVDDDRNILQSLSIALQAEGFVTRVYSDGEAALKPLIDNPPDLAVFDIKMPRMDGLELLRRLRQDARQAAAPVVIVSAKGEEVDRIVALELGADDYVVKPFNMRELFARAKNLLRRTLALRKLRQDEPVIQFAGWTLNVPRRTLLSPSNEDVRLTQFEFELLLTLARNPGCVLSRDSLIDRVGGRDRAPNDRTIDVLVGRIRRKIEANPKDPRIVITVQGVGYVLAA